MGFRDAAMSRRWLRTAQQEVTDYLRGIAPGNRPVGIERTVSVRTGTVALTGRIDRLDDRPTSDGGRALVVVDYKTSRRPSTVDELRTSLPMAMYAVAVAGMFKRPCVDVELHHVPTGTVARHRHTAESLDRKVGEVESIAVDLRRADADHRDPLHHRCRAVIRAGEEELVTSFRALFSTSAFISANFVFCIEYLVALEAA